MSISLREESGGLLNDAEWSLTANHPKEKGKQLQEKKKRIFQEEAEWIMGSYSQGYGCDSGCPSHSVLPSFTQCGLRVLSTGHRKGKIRLQLQWPYGRQAPHLPPSSRVGASGKGCAE